MTNGICCRCNRFNVLAHVSKCLCHSCYVSLRDHDKRVQGRMTEKERQKDNKFSREWYKNHKQEQKLNVLKDYHKNKRIWYVRQRTRLIREDILNKFNHKCKQCKSNKSLELHHLKYDKDDIINFVDVLCRVCHRKLHRLSNVDK